MHILRPAPFVNEAVLRVLYVGVFGGDLHPAPVVVGDIGKKIGGGRTKRSAELKTLENIRILIDTSTIEIFVNDGELAFTTRYYPDEYSFKVCGEMSVKIYQLEGFKFIH